MGDDSASGQVGLVSAARVLKFQVSRSHAECSFSELGGPMIQVEAIGTWSEFCFFVSLFMRHQHALVPLVHKPSFAMDVLNRRDQRDEAFRGLLFSIGSL